MRILLIQSVSQSVNQNTEESEKERLSVKSTSLLKGQTTRSLSTTPSETLTMFSFWPHNICHLYIAGKK